MKDQNNSGILKSSLILLLMVNIFNLLNFIFQIFIAHNLDVIAYGVFTSLFSVIYIFGIFSESIQLTIAKKVAESKSNKNVRTLFSSAMNGGFIISTMLLAVYLLILIVVNKVFQIPLSLILFNGCIVFLSLSSPVIRGILQGQKRFFDLGLNMISEGTVKLGLGVLFLIMGWEVYGVFGAIVASMIISLLYGLVQIKEIFKFKKENKNSLNLLSIFKIDVTLVMSCILLFFMLDVFIARAVLSPELAGYYAIASTIAKTFFIGTMPISKTMLTHVVSAKSKNKSLIFRKSLFLLILILLVGFVLSYLFSDIAVLLFGGADKEIAAGVLPIVAAAVSLLAISNMVLSYALALDKVKNNLLFYLALSVLTLIIALSLAPSTLIGFSSMYLLISIIFLIVSIVVPRW